MYEGKKMETEFYKWEPLADGVFPYLGFIWRLYVSGGGNAKSRVDRYWYGISRASKALWKSLLISRLSC